MWITRLLQKINFRTAKIVYNEHFVVRSLQRDIELDKVTAAIRNGFVVKQKSCRPNKICFKHYFGKENQTYFVIGILRRRHIEVITTWKKKGN